ncbi:MAG: TMAO reductase system periplasmic protein TorT [Rhodobacterales bacterium]|nr:MAG: TMAO reductase system periplasmic protein TorT [Rhodobacterales bacterium]
MKEKMRKSCLSKRVWAMRAVYAAATRAAIGVALVFGFVGTVQAEAGGKRICVVVPHFKDEYWLSVGYGLIEEAKATGSDLLLFESGGYHALRRQIELLASCVEREADAVLLGAVSADDPALLAAVADTARAVPVVALVNELHAPEISGWVGVDWTAMGRVIGRHLAGLYPKGSAPVAAALVTGPAVSGWSPLLEAGLTEGLRNAAVEIHHIGRSDTGLHEQLAQVEIALQQVPQAEILIGSAPAIEGAMGLAATRPDALRPMLVSTYISHSVRRGLQSGKVAAAAFDAPVAQGRLGVRVALNARVGVFSQDLIGPQIVLVRADAPQPMPLAPAGLDLLIE